MRGEPRGFRPDIDGLRALAIVVVVLFHAHVPGFSGGFIGVDVFFVISGYLISRRLFEEMAGSGSVSLGRFWAKRVRRLVPALALMVAVTFLAGLLILSPLEWPSMARDGAASVIYVSNIVFARASTDYFGSAESIFQHTWSLSVEEQFYVIWPLLMLPIAWIGRRYLRASRRLLVGGLVGLVAVSFALNVSLANQGSTWAFYSLPTRMWEFGLAGLLALSDGVRPMRRRASVEAASLLGLGGILGATVLFGDRMAYPGVAALVPVLATALVIRAGASETASSTGRVLSAAPCQAVGRVSYSWYLWHWPAIVLTVAVVRVNTPWVRSIGALIGLGLAVVALRVVENPFRFSPTLRVSAARTFGAGIAISLAVLLLAVGVHVHADRVDDGRYYSALRAAQRWDVDTHGQPTTCAGTLPKVPAEVGSVCVAGAVTGERTVLLRGDSHAAQWLPVFDEVAQARGIRLLVHTYGNCPSVEVPITNETGPTRTDPSCGAFRRRSEQLIRSEHPSAVVLANATYIGMMIDRDGTVPSTDRQVEIWGDAYRRQLARLADDGIPTGVIVDNPRAPFDPITCLGRTRSPANCTFSRRDGLAGVGRTNARVRSVAGEHDGVEVMDTADRICARRECAAVVDGEPIYRDSNHLTEHFVRSMRPDVEHLFDQLLPSTS